MWIWSKRTIAQKIITFEDCILCMLEEKEVAFSIEDVTSEVSESVAFVTLFVKFSHCHTEAYKKILHEI